MTMPVPMAAAAALPLPAPLSPPLLLLLLLLLCLDGVCCGVRGSAPPAATAAVTGNELAQSLPVSIEQENPPATTGDAVKLVNVSAGHENEEDEDNEKKPPPGAHPSAARAGSWRPFDCCCCSCCFC